MKNENKNTAFGFFCLPGAVRESHCKYELKLTDTMEEEEELSCINDALKHLNDVPALYPKGFFNQFCNSIGGSA